MLIASFIFPFPFIVVVTVAHIFDSFACNGLTSVSNGDLNTAFVRQRYIGNHDAWQKSKVIFQPQAGFFYHGFLKSTLGLFQNRKSLNRKRAAASNTHFRNACNSFLNTLWQPLITFDFKPCYSTSTIAKSAKDALSQRNGNNTLANGAPAMSKGIESISFETFLQLLKHYKRMYNSTSIPENFRIPEDRHWNSQFYGFPLGRLCWRMQREHLFLHKNITRKQQVEACGFPVFPVNEYQNLVHTLPSKNIRTRLKQQADFEKLIAGAKVYKKLYKTLDVPYRYKVPNSLPFPKETWGFNLGVALHGVKRAKKYLDLPGSKEALEKLGFFFPQEFLATPEHQPTHPIKTLIDQEWEKLASTSTIDSSEEIYDEESLRENLATIEPLKFGEFESKSDVLSPWEKREMVRKLVDSNVTEVLLLRSDPLTLIPKPTRLETEGGYHYEFDIWSFEDVLKAMQAYNNLHVEFLEEKESFFRPQILINQGFNALAKSWSVPEDDENSDFWPKEWAGMPLGQYLHAFRVGDIDAKNHWKRRVLLDNIGFDWGDGFAYLDFTWKKLFKGLIWWMYFRGHPFCDLGPHSVIPLGSLVGDFAKPEEVHGLQLGYLIQKAWSQETVLWHHFPQRYEFLRSVGLTWMGADQLISEYKLKPDFALPRLPKDLLSEEFE